MADIQARIDLILRGAREINQLTNQLKTIENTVAQIQAQLDSGILGNEKNLKALVDSYSKIKTEAKAQTREIEDQVTALQKSNSETRKRLLIESQLRRERARTQTLGNAFKVETKGLDQTKGKLREIKEEFDDIRRALKSAFQLEDLQIIAKLRNQLGTLVQEQRELNRNLAGTKNTGVNTDLLKEQASAYKREIDALREKATVLQENQQIIQKLNAAEYNLVKQRSESGTFTTLADPRLGRQQLNSVRDMIAAEERLLQTRQRQQKFRSDAFYFDRETNQKIRKMQAGGMPAESFGGVERLLTQFRSAVAKGLESEASAAQLRINKAIESLKQEASINKEILSQNEQASKNAVALANQRLAAVEKIYELEEKIKSFKPIGRQAAEEYYAVTQAQRLALPPGNPNLPAIRGGARSTGPTLMGGTEVDRIREFLGGSRTQEQADLAFRYIKERATEAGKVINQTFKQAFQDSLSPDQLNTLDAVFKTLKQIPQSLKQGNEFNKSQDNLRERLDLLDKEAKKLIGRAVLLSAEEQTISDLLAAEQRLSDIRESANEPVDEKIISLLDLQLKNIKSILNVEDELAKNREKNANKEKANQEKIRNEMVRTITELNKLGKKAAAATFDAVTFGQSANISRKVSEIGVGTRNAAIRGGLGLGALGIGGAYAAAQQAMGNVDLGLLQGPTTQAAGAIGSAINGALGGIPEIIGQMLSALGDIPGALGLAAVAAYAFAPAMKTAADAVFLAGKKFGESKFGENIKLTLDRQTNLFESVINTASQMNMVLDASKSGLDQVGQKIKTLPALPMAGQTSFTGEMRQGRGGGFIGGGARELKNAEFLVNATGKIAERSNIAAETSLLFAEGLGQAATEAKTIADYLREASEMQAKTETRTQRFIRQTREAGRERIQNERSAQIIADRSKFLVGGQYSLRDIPAGGELFPGGNVLTAQPQYRERLNNEALIRQYQKDILDLMTKQQGTAASIQQLEARTLGGLRESIAARKTAVGFSQQEKVTIEQINRENENSIEIIRQRNKELIQRPIAQMTPQERKLADILDPESLRAKRRVRVKLGRERQKAVERATSEGLIGGAFPLLFGQGLGASLGGGLGGAVGGFAGGGLGFGLSLVGTALGTAFDGAIKSATELGNALQKPIENFDKLVSASFFSSKAIETQIKKTIDYGDTVLAAAIIQQESINRLGADGVKGLLDLSKSSDDVTRAWADLNIQLQKALAGPMAGLLQWVTSILKVAAQPGTEASIVSGVAKGLSGNDLKTFNKRRKEITDAMSRSLIFGGITPEVAASRELALAKEFQPKVKRQPNQAPVSQQDINKSKLNTLSRQLEAMDASKAFADQIKKASEEQKNIDKQRLELIRNYEEQIGQIRKKIENEVENRRMNILEKENKILDIQSEIRIKKAEIAASVYVAAAGEGKTQEIRQVARDTATIIASLMQSQVKSEEDMARLKRDSAMEAKRLDFESAKFKVEIEKEVSKLNIDTARQVKEINERIAKMNEDVDTRRFNIEKQITILKVRSRMEEETAIKDQYANILAKTPKGSDLADQLFNAITALDKTIKEFKRQIDVLEKLKPPSKITSVSASSGRMNGNERSSTSRADSGASSNIGMGKIGEQFISLLGNQGGFENVAGLESLPITKLNKWASRPFSNFLDSKGMWGVPANATIPDSVKNEIIRRLKIIEQLKQQWDVFESQWKQRENNWRANPRSKESLMSAEALGSYGSDLAQRTAAATVKIFKEMGRDIYNRYNSSPSDQSISGMDRAKLDLLKSYIDTLGRSGQPQDISSYLTENQKSILSKGIRDVLIRATKFDDYNEGFRYLRNFKKYFKGLIIEVVEFEKARGKFSSPAGKVRLDEINKFLDQPVIKPGVGSQFEGAMLPGNNFNVSKLSRNYGNFASISPMVDAQVLAQANASVPSTAAMDRALSEQQEQIRRETQAQVQLIFTEKARNLGDAERALMQQFNEISESLGEVFKESKQQVVSELQVADRLLQKYDEVTASELDRLKTQADLVKLKYQEVLLQLQLQISSDKVTDAQRKRTIDEMQSLRNQLLAIPESDRAQRDYINGRIQDFESFLSSDDKLTDDAVRMLQEKVNTYQKAISDLPKVIQNQENEIIKLGKQRRAIAPYIDMVKQISATRLEIEKMQNLAYQVTEASKTIGGAIGDGFKSGINAIFLDTSAERRPLADKIEELVRERTELERKMQSQPNGSDQDSERYRQLSEEIARARGELDLLGDTGRRLQQVLADVFQKIADRFLDMAAQMLAQQAILGILRFGASLLPGPKPDLGTSAANLNQYAPLANAKGNVFSNSIVSSPTLFQFANGGALRNGVMGEAGPEAVMPLTRGPGGRLGVDASGSGGDVSVTVNVDASGSNVQGDDQKSSELGRVIAAAVQQELVKQKRPGGILAR